MNLLSVERVTISISFHNGRTLLSLVRCDMHWVVIMLEEGMFQYVNILKLVQLLPYSAVWFA